MAPKRARPSSSGNRRDVSREHASELRRRYLSVTGLTWCVGRLRMCRVAWPAYGSRGLAANGRARQEVRKWPHRPLRPIAHLRSPFRTGTVRSMFFRGLSEVPVSSRSAQFDATKDAMGSVCLLHRNPKVTTMTGLRSRVAKPGATLSIFPCRMVGWTRRYSSLH